MIASLAEIHAEIEQAVSQRNELLRALALRHDRKIVSECAALDKRLAALWESHRLIRARIRYGTRAEIKARAKHEERVLRAA